MSTQRTQAATALEAALETRQQAGKKPGMQILILPHTVCLGLRRSGHVEHGDGESKLRTGQRIVALGAVLLLAWADITCSAAVAVDTRGGGGGIGASLCAAGEGEVAELSASSSPFPPFAGAREYHTAAPFAHWDASSGAFIQGALVYGGRNASHTALSDAFLLTLPPGAAGTNAAGAGAPAIVALSTVAGVAPALFGHVAAWTGAGSYWDPTYPTGLSYEGRRLAGDTLFTAQARPLHLALSE
ncbi:hypothetical protein T484DRAFT_1819801 [Baffinella frigidus]|nr:hypothetical protein T484DRAFT_1819801 [Cryptophyta sp. CCMP2293]